MTFSHELQKGGARPGKRALSAEEVLGFRRRYEEGTLSAREIREVTGLSGETVARMLRGQTYGDVGFVDLKKLTPEAAKASLEKFLKMAGQRGEEGEIGNSFEEPKAVKSDLEEKMDAMSPSARARFEALGFGKK